MTSLPLTTRRVLLGLFIVGQLLFMAVANVNELLMEAVRYVPQEWKTSVEVVAPGWPEKRGAFFDTSRTVHEVTERYVDLTGQEQRWILFGDGYRDNVLVAVEFRWQDSSTEFPPVLLLSDNEPRSMASYFRWGQCGLRRVESQFELFKTGRTDIEAHVRAHQRTMLAFLQWRWRWYLRDHPGTPLPAEAILHVRRYHTRQPEEAPPYLEGPFSVPVACWKPGAHDDARVLPLEAYDPDLRQFRRLAVE